MNKLWIVAGREYRVRVRNKWFLVGTLLTPLLMSLLFVVPILTAGLAEKEAYHVWVIDPTGEVLPKLSRTDNLTFEKTTTPFERLRGAIADTTGVAILVLPSDITKRQLTATFYSPKSPSLALEQALQRELRGIFQDIRLVQAGLDPEQLDKTQIDFDLKTAVLTDEGEQETSTLIAGAVGYIMAFMVYLMMAIYGQVVMTGVMEEKTNRIVEVIASSVRPIQLMIGKIVGIGAVGLTQSLIWIVLISTLLFGFISIYGPEAAAQAQSQQMDAQQLAEAEEMALKIQSGLQQFKPSLIFFFLIYFLGGYLIYGSLFGAVGSAVDQPQDASQFSSLVVMPLIIPMLVLAPVIQSPDSSLAFWMSIIPYFSPTIMMVRLAATDVPTWQVLLSLLFLIGGVYANGWLAAKIYRVGILSYGKKPTFKELARWVVRSN